MMRLLWLMRLLVGSVQPSSARAARAARAAAMLAIISFSGSAVAAEEDEEENALEEEGGEDKTAGRTSWTNRSTKKFSGLTRTDFPVLVSVTTYLFLFGMKSPSFPVSPFSDEFFRPNSRT
jgi:hypothetical protein